MAKLGLRRPIAGCLLTAFLCGCTAPTEPPTDETAPYGDVLVVGVSGRGLVTSDPVGIYCGNDGDQRRCESEFLFEPEARGRIVTLEAKVFPNWTFREWTFSTTGQIPYEPIDPSIDLSKPVLTFTPGTMEEPSGKQRPLRYRVNAIFVPTSEGATAR